MYVCCTSAIRSASPGLQRSSQRRGVMPFVLFWNFSGSSSLKSRNLCDQIEQNNQQWDVGLCVCESEWERESLTRLFWWSLSESQQLHWPCVIPRCRDEPCSPSFPLPPQSETSCGFDPYHLETEMLYATHTHTHTLMLGLLVYSMWD